MKTMTCDQLGGACKKRFSAESFEEIAQMSQEHGKAMFEAQDEAHINAMNKMRELMQDPAQMQKWFEEKRSQFEALPDNN